MKRNKILTYAVAVLGISYLAQIYILQNGGIGGKAFEMLAPIIMFLPGILAILLILITKEGIKTINWKLGKPLYLLYAAFIPSIIALSALFIISFFGWGDIAHFKFADNQIEIIKGKFVLGKGSQSIFFFLLNYILTVVLFSFISGALAFGEELGWRGYLQDKLIAKKGLFWGITILGLIWGFWHFPIILNGYNHPETPVLGAFVLFPLTTIFASFFLAWLTIKAESFWPAVIAHGNVNAFIGSFVGGMNYNDGNRIYADILVLILWGVIAVLSFRSIKKNKTSNRNTKKPINIEVVRAQEEVKISLNKQDDSM